MILRVLILLGATGLAACTPGAVTQNVTLLNGELNVAAPPDYCADLQSSRLDAGFAVFAPCASLVADAPMPSALGLVTVQAGAPDSAVVARSPAQLRNFLISRQGMGVLAMGGDPAQLAVISARIDGPRVIVHLRSEAPAAVAGLGTNEWRGFTDLQTRLVTVSVRDLASAPLSPQHGRSLLDQAMARLTVQ